MLNTDLLKMSVGLQGIPESEIQNYCNENYETLGNHAGCSSIQNGI